MSRAARAVIDLAAFRHNYRLAKRLAPHSKAVAVVKADAYGHGAVPLARTLQAEADAFAVACIEEALDLRQGGIEGDIVLLEGPFTPDELPVICEQGFSTAIHCAEQVEWLTQAELSRPLNVWLKLDSGMHRLGFMPEEYADIYAILKASSNVADIVLMTHFACADELDNEYTNRQLETFKRATRGIDAPVSLSNSPATLAWPATHGDWVRPGMMLYGARPLDRETPASAELKPVMTLESEIIGIHDLQPGEPIGYGRRFVTDRSTRVGTVAMGYGDGYPRHAKDGTPVAVNGQRTRLIGRISMDMLTVDLTGLGDVKVGDRVELWGNTVSLNEVAEYADTIPYELVTRMTQRPPRIYIDSEE